jgi:hypothetical protein
MISTSHSCSQLFHLGTCSIENLMGTQAMSVLHAHLAKGLYLTLLHKAHWQGQAQTPSSRRPCMASAPPRPNRGDRLRFDTWIFTFRQANMLTTLSFRNLLDIYVELSKGRVLRDIFVRPVWMESKARNALPNNFYFYSPVYEQA